MTNGEDIVKKNTSDKTYKRGEGLACLRLYRSQIFESRIYHISVYASLRLNRFYLFFSGSLKDQSSGIPDLPAVSCCNMTSPVTRGYDVIV